MSTTTSTTTSTIISTTISTTTFTSISSKSYYSSGPSAETISTQTLASRLTICEDWNISVDLKLPSQFAPTCTWSTCEWPNIFSLQVNGTIDGEMGSRIPAVWIIPYKQDLIWIGISTQIGDEYGKWSQTPEIKTDQWVNLKISQRKDQATNEWIFEVKLDNKQVYSISNSNPQNWSNVNVIMGNMYEKNESESAKGEYRSFELSSCKL